MTATVVERVRVETETELDRLGSEKSLLALTEARLESEPVLRATGGTVATARATVEDWAADAGGPTADALARAADDLGDACDRVADALGADLPGESPFVTLAAAGDEARAGAALVGLPLVLDALFLQGVSFFVNEADERRADLFRELRETADGMLALAADLDLGDPAVEAARAVVAAAYEVYVERLEGMGFDPKPIC
jgi:hypothetical protein